MERSKSGITIAMVAKIIATTTNRSRTEKPFRRFPISQCPVNRTQRMGHSDPLGYISDTSWEIPSILGLRDAGGGACRPSGEELR